VAFSISSPRLTALFLSRSIQEKKGASLVLKVDLGENPAALIFITFLKSPPDPHLLDLAAPIHIWCDEASTPASTARTIDSSGSSSGRPESGRDVVIRSASPANHQSSGGGELDAVVRGVAAHICQFMVRYEAIGRGAPPARFHPWALPIYSLHL
jgi:hypothetical protein